MQAHSLDWNMMWQEALKKSSLEWWKDPVNFWNERAEGFHKMPRQDWRAKKVIEQLSIEPEHTILDIGAGSGILTVPFAEYAEHVTAIEPSQAMLKSLQQRAKSQNLNNVSCLQKRWEEVELDRDFGKHDLVIASYSLAMFDLRQALLKMHNTATAGVCIFTFAGGIAGSRNYEELWYLLYGEQFQENPDYIYVYNILYQLGIFANVHVEKGLLKQKYASLKEARDRWQDTLKAPGPEAGEIIADYLQKKLLKGEADDLYLIQETSTAMLWWKK